MWLCVAISLILNLDFSAFSEEFKVKVFQPKLVGQKVFVQFAMENLLSERIDSGRATLFLMDQESKVAGIATRWVIGGARNGLLSGENSTYTFVVKLQKAVASTNLTPRLQFNRVVLKGGQLLDLTQQVKIDYVK